MVRKLSQEASCKQYMLLCVRRRNTGEKNLHAWAKEWFGWVVRRLEGEILKDWDKNLWRRNSYTGKSLPSKY